MFAPLRPILVGLFLAAAGTASAQTEYKLDDGSPDGSLSWPTAADYCWFQSFDTVGPNDSIVDLKIMFEPGVIPADTRLGICVWEDPDDDGEPGDAWLVSSTSSTATGPGSARFGVHPLRVPALVHGRFFVGAFLTTDGDFGPIALLDAQGPDVPRAFFAVARAGKFDPTQLGTSAWSHIEALGGPRVHGAFLLRADGSGYSPETYCAPKVNSAGCLPRIGWSGIPSASSKAGFRIEATQVLNHTPGLLVYTTYGRAREPFRAGSLCISSPVERTAPQVAAGPVRVGKDCSGTFSFDFNEWNWIKGGPRFPAGTVIQAQYVSRDPGYPFRDAFGLTDALEFMIQP